MIVASIELQAGKDVKKGEVVTIEELFPWQDYDEVRKVFELSRDVDRGMPINVKIDRVGTLATKADIDKKVGQRPLIGLWMLLSFTDLRRRITALGNVKKNESLLVRIEAD